MFGFRSFGGGMFGAGTAVDPVTGSGGGDPTVTSVQINPGSPTITGGGTQQFSAAVFGTNSPPQEVTWTKVSGVGSINASGLYTAPAATASDQTATIRATSTFDPSKSTTTVITIPSATAEVTVTSVQINPASPTIPGGGTEQFTAVVNGANGPPQTVTWARVSGVGSINASGLYTAPAGISTAQTATIRATSTFDNTKSVTTVITIPATTGETTVTSVQINPASPTVPGGGTQQFTAVVNGTNSPSQSVTWAKISGAGTLSPTGMFTAPAATTVSQSATIRATSVFDSTKSITTTITIPAEVTDPGEIVYPPPSTVLLGTKYGPTGVEYTGTLVPGSTGPTAAEIAAAVWAYETALSIPNYLGLKE